MMIDRAAASPLMPEEVSKVADSGISNKPWSQFSAADYADANDYCRACLIDENTSGTKVKGKCHLPVREPKGGPLNANGVMAAAARLAGAGGGVNASPASKRSAARKLLSLYARMGKKAPGSIARLGRST